MITNACYDGRSRKRSRVTFEPKRQDFLKYCLNIRESYDKMCDPWCTIG